VVLVLLAAVAGAGAFAYMRTPRLTPALRGRALAEHLGCFGCHGPGGTGGIPNPTSEESEIPSWDGGTAMMYVENEEEIREWILYGEPKRLAEKEADAHTHQDDDDGAGTEATSLPIDMPAFEGVISARELEDLVAYYRAVAAFDKPPPEALEGYRIAGRFGCFGCHGPGGLVGSTNPRSFKGYIPPWTGKDFAELVRNDDELRKWILDGRIDRLESDVVAAFFSRRQIVQMPAYRDVLTEDELDAVVRYIRWLEGRS
jgi:mono/diheme cytochrome c family protein